MSNVLSSEIWMVVSLHSFSSKCCHHTRDFHWQNFFNFQTAAFARTQSTSIERKGGCLPKLKRCALYLHLSSWGQTGTIYQSFVLILGLGEATLELSVVNLSWSFFSGPFPKLYPVKASPSSFTVPSHALCIILRHLVNLACYQYHHIPNGLPYFWLAHDVNWFSSQVDQNEVEIGVVLAHTNWGWSTCYYVIGPC